jgi:two-component system, cell cycle response regulator DivK
VLIVEDHGDTRDMYVRYLAHAGWLVEAVVNGEEALAVAASFQPEIIVMDLSMPVVDGLEATRRLKSDRRTRAIPILALSAELPRMGDALNAGCLAFIAKPCTPAYLLTSLEMALTGTPDPVVVASGSRGPL